RIGQNATIRAQVGQSAVTLSMAISPNPSSLLQLTCSPTTLVPGSGGTCSVTLTQAAPSASTITLRSTNAALILPATLTVPQGGTGGTFTCRTLTSMTAWSIISANLGTVTKTATVSAATGTPGGSANVSSALRIRCDRGQIPAGSSSTCEILYNGNEDDSE